MQHDWVPSTLGHGETMCRRCFVTNREAAVLGTLNYCDVPPKESKDGSQDHDRAKVLVAGSKRHADNTAIIDWGWRRGPQGWIDSDGDPVRYVDRIDQLYGLPRGGVTVYLGYEWYANRALQDLEAICASREYKMTYGKPAANGEEQKR